MIIKENNDDDDDNESNSDANDISKGTRPRRYHVSYCMCSYSANVDR